VGKTQKGAKEESLKIGRIRQMTEKRFTIGTDPEFFLQESDTGKLKCAIPFIKGTKEEPEALPSGKGSIQKDNVALEFATAPAKDGNEFVENIRVTFQDIMNVLPKGHELVVTPSAEFDKDQLEDPEACIFGCDPDYDAWTISQNEKPFCSNESFRSCGGHIHIGKVEGDGNDFLYDPMGKILVIKMMDTFHGIISTILDRSEASVARRQLYGKAGCHRPTEYGVEYRVLSNYWLKSPHLVMLMDSLTQDVLRLIREGRDEEIINAAGADEIQNIINEGRMEEAEKILHTILKQYLSEDSSHYLEECTTNIESYDFKKEWQLEVNAS
jgi:hypothetical protein